MNEQELKIKLYGRVQGVNLRNTIQEQAEKEGLKGVVLNREDGTVDIIAQGNREQLQQFLVWLQQNPGFSVIKGMTFHWEALSQPFNDFTIIRSDPFLIDQAKSMVNLTKSILSKKEKNLTVPKHVAIIPDGNRRWAKNKGLAPQRGHYTAGSFQHIRDLFDESRRLGIKYLTLWGFSTENWKRSDIEVKAIFDLIIKSVDQFKEDAHANKIRFRHLGRKDRLPPELITALTQLEQETAQYSQFNVQLCLDYGGRDELIRAVNKLLKEDKKEVDESIFENYLDSSGIPDVDLIIRTSGEQRTSGFMPYQGGYAELYFCSMHFPDFNAQALHAAIQEFSNRQRRLGA